MKEFYKQFCKETFDEKGRLASFEPVYPDNFNFGYDVVDKIAQQDPNRKAVVWCNVRGEERILTFAEITKYSNQVANVLLTHGIKKGDAVMVVLKRHFEYWYVAVALHKIGAIIIPGTNLLTAKDFLYRFQSADVKAVIVTPEGDVANYVDAACEKGNYTDLKAKFIVRQEKAGWQMLEKEMATASDALQRIATKAEDPMLLFFTSGTTGYPKMVLHDFTYPLGHIVTARYWHNSRDGDLQLSVAETGWAKAAWGKIYGEWICGATVFVYDFDKFIPENLLAVMEKYKVTNFCAPPTIYRFIIKGDIIKNYDLSSIRYAATAGEALNAEVYNRFLEYTGIKIMEGFGQTESTLLIGNLVGTNPKAGSLGKASPLYHIALIDGDSKPVKTGEIGEIAIDISRGKQVGLFCGYYKNKEATDDVWHDGYYRTKDLAWQDEQGYYWYVGRNDDVIKASGYRIGPFEVESVLMEHPAVLECAVTGAPDPIRGVVVKATIVLTKNYAPSDALVKEIQTFVKKQTAPYKYPRIVEFVEELPKTISGKIRRNVIRKQQ